MPPKGKCEICGEIAYLYAKVLINKETGLLQCVMVCDECRRYYEAKEE